MTDLSLQQWLEIYKAWLAADQRLRKFRVELEQARRRYRGATLQTYRTLLLSQPVLEEEEATRWGRVVTATEEYMTGRTPASLQFFSARATQRIRASLGIVQGEAGYGWELLAVLADGVAVKVDASNQFWQSENGARANGRKAFPGREY